MPIITCQIRSVDGYKVRHHTTRYDVLAVPAQGDQMFVSTVNQWQAALCQRARDTATPVRLTWKDGRYGRELVDVQLVAA